ncbi:hypothetical protein EDF78_101365 [Rahnella sp. BIGb0236]|nr:hypothetical protein EDF78_101365 [Rahnella sp. BIGb0236]
MARREVVRIDCFGTQLSATCRDTDIPRTFSIVEDFNREAVSLKLNRLSRATCRPCAGQDSVTAWISVCEITQLTALKLGELAQGIFPAGILYVFSGEGHPACDDETLSLTPLR